MITVILPITLIINEITNNMSNKFIVYSEIRFVIKYHLIYYWHELIILTIWLQITITRN